MIVKKFKAPTEKEAILKAQSELGNKAVVLNVKVLKQRGVMKFIKRDVVEVTAALEEDDFINEINKRKPDFESSFNKASGQSLTNTTSKIDLVADDNTLVTNMRSINDNASQETEVIEKKLDSLHNLLRNQMSATDRKVRLEERETISDDEEEHEGARIVRERENSNMKFLKLIYNKLIDNEVNEKYADQIIGEIENSLQKESNIDSILSAVYQKIILKLGEPKKIELSDKPKVLFFIGPTGVGKTTTIAKIASRFKLEERVSVAFVTSDTYRIAAVDQLNTYASIMDSPISVVYSSDDLAEALEAYKNFDMIMVDTAGRSHKCEEQMDELAAMLEKAQEYKDVFDIEIFLVLSVTTKYKDLVNITQRYKDIDKWSVIFTKLDETCCLGNILNVRLLTNSQVSYTTSGQNVPNDIELINKQALAKQLLGGN